MAEPSVEQVLASYAERQLNLTPDSSSQELSGQLNKDGIEINRPNVHARDLSHLQASATLKRVQYGKWEQDKACLLNLDFKFSGGIPRGFRFKEVHVDIGLKSRTSKAREDCPVVKDFGPRSLQSAGTDSTETPSWTGRFSLKASVGPVEIGPEIERGESSQYTRHYAQEVRSNDVYDAYGKPTRVTMWATEDRKQQEGIPDQISAAVIFSYTSDSLAVVKVECDTLFNMVARPWGKDDPILLDERVPWGPPIREQEGSNLDFATLTDKDWKELVTPDLKKRNVLHQNQQAQ